MAERVNAWTVSTLTLHFPSRDVNFEMDGTSALRILEMFRLGTTTGRDDPVSARVKGAAASLWFAFDFSQPLAMSWAPAGAVPQRIAMDPAVPS